MKALIELTSIVSPANLKMSRSVNWKEFSKSQTYELYKLVRSKEIKSEEELIKILYGQKKAARTYYRRLKKRLEEVLLSVIRTSPDEKKTDYNSVYNFCYKRYADIKVLMRNGAKELAILLAHATLKKARKYSLTEICLGLSEVLMIHYGLIGNEAKMNFYSNSYDQYNQLKWNESKARRKFHQAAILIENKKKHSATEKLKVANLLTEITKIEGDSLLLIQTKFRAELIKQNMENDYSGSIQTIKKAFNYFDSLPFKIADGNRFLFLNKLSPLLILTKKYDQARSNIDQTIEMSKLGHRNWHIALQYRTILGFYSKDYELAKESIELGLKRIKKTARAIGEYWLVLEAYLCFLSLADQVELNKSFRLSKFLNSFSVYSNDKIGANASIIIVQLLVLLKTDKGKMIDKRETIMQYIHNYLKTEESIRANLFIRILRQLIVSQFSMDQFEKDAQSFVDELMNTDRTIADIETEPIPYPDLMSILGIPVKVSFSV